VPYAIGNCHLGLPNGGGHKDIEPSLGTLEDFAWLEKEIRARGLEIALDFAINCSPDHPYVEEHPEWFYKRPDGTIKYAENPPKKYEDIYPLNFRCPNWLELWEEMKSIILFWAEHGVRIFRVIIRIPSRSRSGNFSSPGCAKNFPIRSFFRSIHPPKDDESPGQSRLHPELYLLHLAHEQARADRVFHRADADPDARIFPRQPLYQHAGHSSFSSSNRGRPMFQIRAVLAATLSSVYGICSGFELCENAALPGREEYFDSEKYQFKERDWDSPGNIKRSSRS
jgi:starch synthase (maltosyl-transferring)